MPFQDVKYDKLRKGDLPSNAERIGRMILDCKTDLRVFITVNHNNPLDPEAVQVGLAEDSGTAFRMAGFGSMSLPEFLDALGITLETVEEF